MSGESVPNISGLYMDVAQIYGMANSPAAVGVARYVNDASWRDKSV